jgi:hypothetical protein
VAKYQQQQQAGKPMNNRQALEHIEATLRKSMPHLKYSYKTNEKGRYLVVEQSGIVGIGIWYSGGKLALESIIPSEKLNKRFGKAAKFFHVFRRKKRHALVDDVMDVIKTLTK